MKSLKQIERAARWLRLAMGLCATVILLFIIFCLVLSFWGITNDPRVEKFIADPSMYFGGTHLEFVFMLILYTIEYIFWLAITFLAISLANNTISNHTPYTSKNMRISNYIFRLYLFSTLTWYVGILLVFPFLGGLIGLHNIKPEKIVLILVFYYVVCLFNKGNDLQIESDELL